MMEVRQALRTRRSVRSFLPAPVPREQIMTLLELANWAPSAGNLQSRDFVVVREGLLRRALASAALDQEFIAQAPIDVVVCANLRRVSKYGDRGRQLYAVQDAAAATMNLLLAAHDAGFGAVWVGAFDEAAVRDLLRLPDHVRPVAIVPLGYPTGETEPSDRLPIERLVHWDRW